MNRPAVLVTVVTALVVGSVAVVTPVSDPAPVPPPPARLGTLPPTPRAPASPSRPPPAHTPYDTGIDAAARRGLDVWIEVDMAASWVAGPKRWRQTLDYVGGMARRPGVVGIKIADELGYQDRLGSVDGVVRFLRAARADLAEVAPGKKILVDFYVSDAGCLPGTASTWARDCAAEFRRRHPRCTLEAVDRYLRTGAVDVVSYAPEILSDGEYDGGTVDPERAMRAAWQEARRRGWDRLVTLNGRLGAAFPGTYPYGRRHADETLRNELDVPFLMGARAVDVWTWRQHYEGKVFHLTDPGLRPNHLWRGLLDRRARGARLFTHFDPTIVDRGLDADLDVIKTVFSDIYVMPGLGW
jgi:hypothetical protein